jgi:hypothetical protein
MRRSDIASHPFPEDQVFLTALSKLAVIIEEAIDLLYTQRADSLHHLHATAEKLYATLFAWGKEYSISSEAAKHHQTMSLAPVPSLFLHSGEKSSLLSLDGLITKYLTVYFHTVLLVFRPFMIAAPAIGVDSTLHLSSELWLRQACRRATDTAQDAIFFVNNMYEQFVECRVGLDPSGQ